MLNPQESTLPPPVLRSWSFGNLQGSGLSAPDLVIAVAIAIMVSETLIARSGVFSRGAVVEHRLAQPIAVNV